MKEKLRRKAGSRMTAERWLETHTRRAIRRFRVRAGLTQKELGQKIGRTHAYISMIEKGKRNVGLLEFVTILEAIGTEELDTNALHVLCLLFERCPSDAKGLGSL